MKERKSDTETGKEKVYHQLYTIVFSTFELQIYQCLITIKYMLLKKKKPSCHLLYYFTVAHIQNSSTGKPTLIQAQPPVSKHALLPTPILPGRVGETQEKTKRSPVSGKLFRISVRVQLRQIQQVLRYFNWPSSHCTTTAMA